jgi:hypothetical protein
MGSLIADAHDFMNFKYGHVLRKKTAQSRFRHHERATQSYKR